MAPKAGGGGGGGCTTRRRVRPSTRKTTRTHYKKRVLKPKNIQETPQQQHFSKSTQQKHPQEEDFIIGSFDEDEVSTSGCSTPKAERFRIPEIVTCPPAPKKPRPPPPAAPNCSSSLHRSPIAFFASPDIELFFFCALSDVSG